MMTLAITNIDASVSSPFIDDVSVCPTPNTCAAIVNAGFEADLVGQK
jgi:hypothetical protein